MRRYFQSPQAAENGGIRKSHFRMPCWFWPGWPIISISVGRVVVDAAIAVHRAFGPGLLETVYEVALTHALQQRGLQVERQIPIPIRNRGISFDEGFRADIIVDSKVILEFKSVEHTTAAHRKQIQTYLRLTGCKLGFLLNFGEALMKDGVSRAVNGLEE